ncbi:DUF2617 family protein [Halopelagius fulvigenes]|uniref:DUF2617 family protein n=1 Tax=Halopelagius fulvigenes TaxID=1198324 RepID=A0ABD5TXG2_9EURY
MSPNTLTDAPSELYFAYAGARPDFDRLDVKAVHADELLGRPAALTIIGESHYVGLPSLGFHELCSCRPLSAEPTHETPLSVGVEREFRFRGDRIDATTTVTGRPLNAFSDPDEATVAYRFAPDAWTTISVGATGYETYHTYPEHGLALHTETRLTARGSPAQSERLGDPTRNATENQP